MEMLQPSSRPLEQEQAQSAKETRAKALQRVQRRGSSSAAAAGRAGALRLAVDVSMRGITIDAMPTDTLARLRARIAVHGIAPEMQCVMAAGQALEEGAADS